MLRCKMRISVINKIQIVFFTMLLSLLCISFVCETGLLPASNIDVFKQENGIGYYIYTMCLLLVLVCIPVALKMMTIDRVKKYVNNSDSRYFTVSMLRLTILYIPALLGLVMYYLTYNPSYCYCTGIAVIAFMFVWPTEDRMSKEIASGVDVDKDN